VVNVGAGAGAYEPTDRRVTAVEPSPVMRAQRAAGAAPVLAARAEQLPFADASFDAAMAVWTVHHWDDADAGLRELRRVARGPVVVATWDPAFGGTFWLLDRYLPQLRERDATAFPAIDRIARALGGHIRVSPLPIPRDCADGFLGAFWARPEAYLDPAVRAGMSTLHALDAAVVAAGLARLEEDLASGEWDALHGDLRRQAECDLGYRLVVATTG
jgi:SAM-dependent methyltransferase